MRCLLFEPHHGGHHFQYLRHLVPALTGLADEVIVVIGRGAVETAPFREFLEPIASGMTIDPVLEPAPSGFRRAYGLTSALRAAIRRHRADHVLVPYANGISQVLGMQRLAGRVFARGVEAEGLLMAERFAYPVGSRAESLKLGLHLFAVARAPWTILHHLDPIAHTMIMRRGGALARRSRLMPEPVEPIPRLEPGDARRRLGIPEDGRYLGYAGQFSRRRGPDLLLRAFARAACASNDRLLLAGIIEPWLRPIIDRECAELVRHGRLVTIDRFLTEDELAWSLSAVDVVTTPYRSEHYGSSGFVVRAPAAGRPVLGGRTGWIGHTIERFGLGWTCDVLDLDELASTIVTALDHAAAFAPGEAARRFVEYHTVPNFAAAWTARLRERVGAPPAPDQRSWTWVSEPLRGEPERPPR